MIAVAPDAASVNAGRKLAVPGPWSGTGSNDTLLWGSCQGSGKKPYQVSVDLLGPAYKCTCPSRKFPCKHAIALLLLWSDGLVGDGAAADFAAGWAEKRSERASGVTAPVAAPDPEAQAARRAERLAKMDAGAAEFVQWLTDLMRGGLADALRRPESWWDASAARLVDAQLPGLAERLRDTAGDVAHGLSPAELLERIGVWWTMVRAWSRRDELSPALLTDLRTALGWPVPTAEVRAGVTRDGIWTVAGSHRDETGRLLQQRTWLRSVDSGDFFMVLDTVGPGQSLGVPHLAGAGLHAHLGLYPGTPPQRVLFIQAPVPESRASDVADSDAPVATLGTGRTVAEAFAEAAAAVARVPWRDRHPVVLNDMVLGGTDLDLLVDPAGDAVPLTADTPHRALLAVTGGRADQIFGELDRGRLRVLTVIADGQATPL